MLLPEPFLNVVSHYRDRDVAGYRDGGPKPHPRQLPPHVRRDADLDYTASPSNQIRNGNENGERPADFSGILRKCCPVRERTFGVAPLRLCPRTNPWRGEGLFAKATADGLINSPLGKYGEMPVFILPRRGSMPGTMPVLFHGTMPVLFHAKTSAC